MQGAAPGTRQRGPSACLTPTLPCSPQGRAKELLGTELLLSNRVGGPMGRRLLLQKPSVT